MKKMNYPKVIFRPYINENKEWKILPYVTLPDIYKFVVRKLRGLQPREMNHN